VTRYLCRQMFCRGDGGTSVSASLLQHHALATTTAPPSIAGTAPPPPMERHPGALTFPLSWIRWASSPLSVLVVVTTQSRGGDGVPAKGRGIARAGSNLGVAVLFLSPGAYCCYSFLHFLKINCYHSSLEVGNFDMQLSTKY
jgi:hypothetical protein